MIRLHIEQVKMLHSLLITQSGGLDGLRDEGLLDSALQSPFQTFDSLSVYPSLEMKAARLGFSLVSNHPFVDGNKRIGILVMLTFLELNSVLLQYTDDELIAVGLALANGSMNDKALVQWIYDHSE